MNVWQSIFFGLIQGLHRISARFEQRTPAPRFRAYGSGMPAFHERYAARRHAFFAVIIAYRKPLLQILRHPISDKRLLYLVIASIPTFIIAAAVKFFLPEGVDKYILPVGFALTAALLLLSSLNKTNFP